MIQKEKRDEILKNLSKGIEGQALKEYLEEMINKMTDISTITSYEELIGKQVTIKLMKETLRFLDLLAKTKTEKEPNQYV